MCFYLYKPSLYKPRTFLTHIIHEYLALVVTIKQFFKVLLLSYILPAVYESFCCSTSSPTVSILILAILVG